MKSMTSLALESMVMVQHLESRKVWRGPPSDGQSKIHPVELLRMSKLSNVVDLNMHKVRRSRGHELED